MSDYAATLKRYVRSSELLGAWTDVGDVAEALRDHENAVYLLKYKDGYERLGARELADELDAIAGVELPRAPIGDARTAADALARTVDGSDASAAGRADELDVRLRHDGFAHIRDGTWLDDPLAPGEDQRARAPTLLELVAYGEEIAACLEYARGRVERILGSYYSPSIATNVWCAIVRCGWDLGLDDYRCFVSRCASGARRALS